MVDDARLLPPRPVDASSGGLSRRALVGGILGAAVGAPLLSGCTGFVTSGAGAGEGGVAFLSTQFTPIEERSRFEQILKQYSGGIGVAYNPVEPGVFASTVTSQVEADRVQVSLMGGLHGDLAPLADKLVPLDDFVAEFGTSGIAPEQLELAKVGGRTTMYVPWMQATYVVAVHKRALEWLPSGADVRRLTYDQYLDWAVAARRANGKPVFGLPGGPKGLLHRFFQGYLLPSFTGGQITTFRGAEAVGAWEYMRELWANTAPASTNYDFMQEPLQRGEVLVAWDHVARLVNAPAGDPDDWLMVPAPRGPKGLGYMLVLAGLAIPRGAPEGTRARQLVRSLTLPRTQVEVLRKNAFFPVVETELGKLPAAIQLEATAVEQQRSAKDAVLALPPVGLGEKDGEVSQLFKNCFAEICLKGRQVRPVLDVQARQLAQILAELKVPCWAPDPVHDVCQVG